MNKFYKISVVTIMLFMSFTIHAAELLKNQPLKTSSAVEMYHPEKADKDTLYASDDGFLFIEQYRLTNPNFVRAIESMVIAYQAKCGEQLSMSDVKALVNNNSDFLLSMAHLFIIKSSKDIETECTKGRESCNQAAKDSHYAEYINTMSQIKCDFFKN